MANIIEKTGKSYNIFDKINNVWNKCSFWTHSNDVFYPDGKSATTKHGAINGITSDLSGEAEDIAASIKCVNQLNSSLTTKTSNIKTYVGSDGKLHFKDASGADTVLNFSSSVFGTHTFTKGEVLEIDTGLSKIKHFVLHNTLTETNYNDLIYDSSYPTKYRATFDIGWSNRCICDIGTDKSDENFYSLLSINGGKVEVKAPTSLTSSNGDWTNITWIAQ